MGYTHDRQGDDAMDLALALLVRHAADRRNPALDPELSELLLRGPIPGRLRIPADLLSLEDFDPVQMQNLGITIEPVQTRHGVEMCATIEDPVLSALVAVAEDIESEASVTQAMGPPNAAEQPAARVISFSDRVTSKKGDDGNNTPKTKKDRDI